jgi:dTDP-4-amino-4,6-dideoxygalactose transaminase
MAEKAVREVLSLPLHPYLSEVAIDAACAAVEDFTA